jgi:hypothetical protein
MAKYTTQLRSICESLVKWAKDTGYEPEGYGDTAEIIEGARTLIFSFDYPIFDVSYKSTLENKIIEHFYFREICCETYGLWKFMLQRKMREIMPYYNQLYKSALIEFNPMYNTERVVKKDSVENRDRVNADVRDNVGFSESESKMHDHSISVNEVKTDDTTDTSHSNWEAFSDTPQGGLTGIANNQYLTNATHTWSDTPEHRVVDRTVHSEDEYTEDKTEKGESKVQNSSQGSEKEVYTGNGQYLEYVMGKEGTESYSEMLLKYRKTFLNIDMMVIGELEKLFFGLW